MATENNFVRCVLRLPSVLDGSESKGRFFLQNESIRIESIRIANWNALYSATSCGDGASNSCCLLTRCFLTAALHVGGRSDNFS